MINMNDPLPPAITESIAPIVVANRTAFATDAGSGGAALTRAGSRPRSWGRAAGRRGNFRFAPLFENMEKCDYRSYAVAEVDRTSTEVRPDRRLRPMRGPGMRGACEADVYPLRSPRLLRSCRARHAPGRRGQSEIGRGQTISPAVGGVGSPTGRHLRRSYRIGIRRPRDAVACKVNARLIAYGARDESSAR